MASQAGFHWATALGYAATNAVKAKVGCGGLGLCAVVLIKGNFNRKRAPMSVGRPSQAASSTCQPHAPMCAGQSDKGKSSKTSAGNQFKGCPMVWRLAAVSALARAPAPAAIGPGHASTHCQSSVLRVSDNAIQSRRTMTRRNLGATLAKPKRQAKACKPSKGSKATRCCKWPQSSPFQLDKPGMFNKPKEVLRGFKPDWRSACGTPASALSGWM